MLTGPSQPVGPKCFGLLQHRDATQSSTISIRHPSAKMVLNQLRNLGKYTLNDSMCTDKGSNDSREDSSDVAA